MKKKLEFLYTNKEIKEIFAELSNCSDSTLVYNCSALKKWEDRYSGYYHKIVGTEAYRRWLEYDRNREFDCDNDKYSFDYEYLEGVFTIYYKAIKAFLELNQMEFLFKEELQKYDLAKDNKPELIKWVKNNLKLFDLAHDLIILDYMLNNNPNTFFICDDILGFEVKTSRAELGIILNHFDVFIDVYYKKKLYKKNI